MSYMNDGTVVSERLQDSVRKFRGMFQRMRKAASATRSMPGRRGVFLSAAIFLAFASAQGQTVFGPQNVGSTSAAQTVTVTAQAAGQVSNIEVLTIGAPNLDFATVTAGSTCAAANLLRNQTCTQSVTFTPTAPGVRNGAVLLIDGAGSVVGYAYLAGTGLGGLGVFQPGTMQTVAGNGQFEGVGDGAKATTADLDLPSGVAVDGAGNLYIADSAHNRIRKVTAATGLISTIAGNGNPSYKGDDGPAVDATLNTPSGITIDGAGNLYIADTGNNVVRRITAATGIIKTVAGDGTAGYSGDNIPATTAELDAPSGVTVDAAGNIYIADTNNHRIRLVTFTSGLITTVAGNGANGGEGGGTYSGDGGPAVLAGLNFPHTVVFDTAGNMYIPDSGNNRVREVSASTKDISTFAGTGGGGYNGDGVAATAASVYSPSGLAFDPAGNLYIADTGNNRIRKVSSASGMISTFAGNGNGLYFVGSGAATVAGIYGPMGLWFDQAGNLYIADYFDQRIRQVQDNLFEVKLADPLAVGQVSPPQAATVENDGNAPLDFTAFTPDANSAVVAASTTCPLGTPFVAVNTDCVVTTEFAPTEAGDPLTAFVKLLGETPNSPLIVQLTGVVVPTAGSTTTTVTSSLNPSTVGQSVTFTATVTTGAGTGALTGTVSFMDGANVLAAAVPVNAAGVATFATAALAVGSHSITAAYSGDTGHSSSVSAPPLIQVVKPVASPTVTAVTSSSNPSTFGQSVTFTAQVSTVAGTGTLTGTVSFSDGATVLAAAVPLKAGVATFATAALAVGSHSITVAYSGDTAHSASTSTPPLVQVVVAQAASPTVTAITSSLNPSTLGQSVTFTAEVLTAAGTGALTGTVSFSDGATVLTAAVPVNGTVATFATTALVVGSHSITATYSGDAAHSASTSSPPLVQVVVNPASSPTVTGVTSSLNPSTFGQSVTFTAAVSAVAGTSSLTGTVSFKDGGTVLATGVALNAGVATFATSALAVGSHSITAIYGGDSMHSGSTSTAVTQVVNKANTTAGYTLSVTPAALTLNSSQNATVTVTLTSTDGFSDSIGMGCASLPVAVTCHFSNNREGLKANGTSKLKLTIDTNNPLSGGTTSAANSHSGQTTYLAGVFFPFAGVFGWWLWKRRKQHAMFFHAGALLLLVGSAALLVTGCGGFTQNSAAPGTYVIQVVGVGVDSNMTQSQDVTLTITK